MVFRVMLWINICGKSNKKSHASMYPSIKHVEPNNIDQMQNEIKYNTSGNMLE